MIYALILPLALMLGYMLATPTDLSSVATVALIISVLVLPLVLKWHHESLLLSWNMPAVVFFLPGPPELWLVMALVSLSFAVVQRSLNKEMQFISVPSLTLPLVYLLVVVAGTAWFTGGIGVRALGGQSFGGRGYLWIFGGALGFWAITSRRISLEKASLCTGLFLLGGLTNVIPTLIAFGPPEFYNLAMVFPVGYGELGKIASALGFATGFGENIERFSGLTFSCMALFYFMLARYGIRNMLSATKFWKFVLLVALVLIGALGGFRTMIVLLGLTFLLTFYFEGLFRSRYAAIFVGATVLGWALLVPLADKLPLSIQRALSILPLNIDPVARFEAHASSEWRVEMWKILLPEIPHYLWLGKGLAVSGGGMELAGDLAARGQMSSQDLSILVGNYHSGPLTVLIPFGIWGAIGWLWFLIASIRALYLNYRLGDEFLRKINTFLLAYFLARTVVFFTVYGDFRSDVAFFAGIVGFSVALNGGIRKQANAGIMGQNCTIPENSEAMEAVPSMVR
jgi:hypothetical protein